MVATVTGENPKDKRMQGGWSPETGPAMAEGKAKTGQTQLSYLEYAESTPEAWPGLEAWLAGYGGIPGSATAMPPPDSARCLCADKYASPADGPGSVGTEDGSRSTRERLEALERQGARSVKQSLRVVNALLKGLPDDEGSEEFRGALKEIRRELRGFLKEEELSDLRSGPGGGSEPYGLGADDEGRRSGRCRKGGGSRGQTGSSGRGPSGASGSASGCGEMDGSNMSVEDFVLLVLAKLMNQFDKKILQEAKRIQALNAASNFGGGAAGNQTSIDIEAMKLKRLIDKRGQMMDIFRQIIDKYDETAQNVIRSIAR